MPCKITTFKRYPLAYGQLELLVDSPTIVVLKWVLMEIRVVRCRSGRTYVLAVTNIETEAGVRLGLASPCGGQLNGLNILYLFTTRFNYLTIIEKT